MPHAMVTFARLPEQQWLHRRQENGLIRASVNFASGPLAGAAFLSEPTPAALRSASLEACPGEECDYLALLNYLQRISHLRPAGYVQFLSLQVRHGSQQAFAGRVVEIASGLKDGTVAAAHAFGASTTNAVVEITGDDHDELLRQSLEIVDTDMVLSVQAHLAAVQDTRGFGSEAVTVPASSA